MPLILISCGQRSNSPAPISYDYEDAKVSSNRKNSEPSSTYIHPQIEKDSELQEEQIIVVKQGESLAVLAKRYSLDSQEIIARNNLMPPYHLFPGQNIKLPADARAQAEPIALKKVAPQDNFTSEHTQHSDNSALLNDEDEEEVLSVRKESVKDKKSNLSIEEREKELEEKFSKLEASLSEPSNSKSSNISEDSENDQDILVPLPKPVFLKGNTKALKQSDDDSDQDNLKIDSSAKPKNVNSELTSEDITPKEKEPESSPPKAAEPVSQKFAAPLKIDIAKNIVSGFNQSPGKLKNDGINIAAPEGTPIMAAQDGVVAYAGNELQGYGNLILLKHPGGWMTAYGHCSKMLVKLGQKVNQGDTIALVGDKGSVRGPQLHFQLRKKSTVVDPMPYLE